VIFMAAPYRGMGGILEGIPPAAFVLVTGLRQELQDALLRRVRLRQSRDTGLV
jgi:hypothetical protein